MRKQEPFILARLTGEAGDRINTMRRQLLVAADRCTLKVLWAGEGMQQAEIPARNGPLSFERRLRRKSAFAGSGATGHLAHLERYDPSCF